MPKSLEDLQRLLNTNRELVRVLDLIWNDIKTPRASSAALHFVNLDDQKLFPVMCSSDMKDTLLSLLKKEYPGCDVRYSETCGCTEKILERVIIIDWSVLLKV